MLSADFNTISFHQLSVEDTIQQLHSLQGGISEEEATQRLHLFGSNELLERREKPWWLLLLNQFADFMILMLLVAAIVSGFVGEITDTIIIIVLVLLNALIGFSQEYRARNAVKALKKMTALNAIVMREEQVQIIPSSQLVPGDILLLDGGNVVSADARLIAASQLCIQESSLTGEAAEIEKNANVLIDADATLGDRINMVYKGTFISSGNGKAVVTATGMKTELGRIAKLLGEEETLTPLQRRMKKFGKALSVIILAVCAVIFIVDWLKDGHPMLMLLTAISLAVAAIPEALPSVITIALSFGAKKMARQNALVKRLPAVETLGAVTYICSDKTGTLTQNKMQVVKVFCNGKMYDAKDFSESSCGQWSLIICALNNTILERRGEAVTGDSTETALYHFALEKNHHRHNLLQQFPLMHTLPFDAERKCMTTIHQLDDAFISFTKGAPDVILPRIFFGNRAERKTVEDAIETMASEGLRAIALAMHHWPQLLPISNDNFEQDLTFVALAGIADPLRPESRTAVELCKTAGIKPIMITGDHALTARVIATQSGIIENADDVLITSLQLTHMSDDVLKNEIEHIKVLARVTPEQKLRIVKTLQQKGEVVAMTGDGVNDAPALQLADIGVAMGINGTDVSKEAADMILLDDNFSTIVKAIKEGRRIFDNIRKFIRYIMTSNAGEVWTISLAPFLGLPVPLLPIHILWINLVTDGLPGLALATERAEKGTMQRPPRPVNENIFSGGMGRQILWAGFLLGAVSIAAQAVAIHYNSKHWQTMVFTVLCLNQLGNAMAMRSETASAFQLGPFSNKFMFYAISFTLLLQLAVIYVPVMNTIFKTQPLTANELLLTILLSSVTFVAIEMEKLVRRIAKRK